MNKANIAEQKIQQGIEAETRADFKQAVVYYLQALEQSPQSERANQLLARALTKIRTRRQPAIANINNSNLASSAQNQQRKYSNLPDLNMSLNPSIPRANWSLAKQPKSTETNLNNLGLIHVPNAERQSLELTSNTAEQTAEQFVLLPKVNDTTDSSPTVEMSAAEVYIGQALMYFEQNQLDDSIAACQEALRVYPQMGEAYKIWGNCLQRQGKSAEAIGIYAKALESKANMAEIYCNLGSIYARQKKWQPAIDNYQKSIIIDAQIATPYRNLARVWDELKEYDKSADCFFKAINLQPNLLSPENHFQLANNLLTEGNRTQAIACYQSCVELEPKFLQAYGRLGDALEADGQKDKALYYYKKLAQLQTETELSPTRSKSSEQISSLLRPTAKRASGVKQLKRLPALNSRSLPQLKPASTQSTPQNSNAASIQFELGNMYLKNKQWQKAIASYRQAIELEPQKAQYHLQLGKAQSKASQPHQANRAYYDSFSLQPDKVSAKNHYLLGDKLLAQNELKKAVECYRRAIKVQPKFVRAYWRLGEIAAEQGNGKTAVGCYRQAIKIEPRQVESYILLGKTYAQQGNWQAALPCYQKAATLKPNSTDVQCKLSQMLASLERYDEATEILERLISQNSQYWQGYHQLGDVLSQQSKWSEAVEAYKRAIEHNPQDNGLAYHCLGQAYSELQQWQRAADAFGQAISLNLNSSWTYYGLGSALNEQEKWQGAIKAFDRCLELNPDFDWAYHKLGNAKAAVQDWQGAANAYQQALEITPGLPYTQDKLEDALAKTASLGSTTAPEKQQSSLQSVLSELPSEPEVYLGSAAERQQP